MTRRLLLVGAGHAQVEVLRAFARRPMPGVALTLASRSRFTPYSGMLPGLVAGLYGFGDAHVDAGRLAAAAGARFVEAEVVGLDLDARQARCADGRSLAYDVLSLDLGATPAGVPGAAEHAVPVKPIAGFVARFDDLLARVGRGAVGRVAVVGAGAGGVEIALAVERRLRAAAGTGRPAGCPGMVLVCGAPAILPGFPSRFRDRLGRILAERGIAVEAGRRVAAVLPDGLLMERGAPVPADAVLWCTGAAPPSWLRHTGLPLDAAGFVAVRAGLDVEGRPDVFAAGDVARFGPRDLPKAGVYAVRQGPVLAGNIRRGLAGRALRPHRPQRDALVLMSTGERHAVGTRNGLVLEGDWLWRLKDRLDRRWVARYRV